MSLNPDKNKKKNVRHGGKKTAAQRRQEMREARADSPYAAFEADNYDSDSYSDFEERTESKYRYSNFSSEPEAEPLSENDYYFNTYYGVGSERTKSRREGSEPKKRDTSTNSSRSAGSSRNSSSSKHSGGSSRPASSRTNSSSKSKNRKSDDYLTEPAKVKELTASQRKLRALLCNIGVFLTVVVIAVIFSVTILFKTDEFVVEGTNLPYDTQKIVDASGLEYGDNIFFSKRKAAAKKIVEQLPYIESAEVDFKIPGTIVITVETAIPSYEVTVNGGYAVISARGRVLEKSAAPYSSIPLLKGVKVTDTEVGQYIKFENSTTQQILGEVIDSINENEVPNIYGVDISNSANIKLNYDNRITILLGVPEDVGYKLRTAMAIINHQLAPTDKGDLDVSLANSDRKASYFTPIYSNTVTIEEKSSDTDTAKENNSQTSSTN